MKKINIVIPAAGVGNKMKSYGPKSLIEVMGSQTLIEHQIEKIQIIFPSSNIYIVSGFESEKLKIKINEIGEKLSVTSDIHIIHNKNYEDTNTAYSISLAENQINNDEKVLVVYGDLMFNEDLLESYAFENNASLLDTKKCLHKHNVGVKIENNFIFEFKFSEKVKWSQTFCLDRLEFSEFTKMSFGKNNHKLFSFEILERMIKQNGLKLKPLINRKYRMIEIDKAVDLNLARKSCI